MLVWRSTELPNLLQPIQVGCTRKNRPPREHLANDTPDTPYVDFTTVMSSTEQELWRAIPSRDDTIGISPLPAARVKASSRHIRVIGPGKTKVSDFKVAAVRYEEIGCLHIAMEDVILGQGFRIWWWSEKKKGSIHDAYTPFLP